MSKENRYYDEEGHLKYIMTDQELTELAQEVASEIMACHNPSQRDVEREIKDLFQARGIAYWGGNQ